MKYLSIFIYLIASLVLTKPSIANVSTQNAAGITITFLDVIENAIAQEILLSAMSLEGIKYKYGGSSPQTGFDCSGFVNYVYDKAANLKLPRTARGISRFGQSVQHNELEPGDLVFFNTTKRAYSHVGIYVGNGKFIHAPSRGGFVRVESMQKSYWAKRYNGAKRIESMSSN